MIVLLDAHAFLWFNVSDPRLSSAAILVIEDASNQVLISPASYWEIAIKISLGRLTLAAPYDVFWKKCIDENGFDILPIKIEHTSRVVSLPFHHKDPFDQLLVAQSLTDACRSSAADAQLDSYGVTRIW